MEPFITIPAAFMGLAIGAKLTLAMFKHIDKVKERHERHEKFMENQREANWRVERRRQGLPVW